MNDYFDLKRLGYLARRSLILDWRTTAIAGGIVGGILVIVRFLEAWFSGGSRGSGTDYTVYLIVTMIIWGCIYASMALSALRDKNRNESYLLLPASAAEKVTVELILGSVILPLGIIILISVASLFTEGLTSLVFGTRFSPLNPFQADLFKVWGYTIIAQSLFFLGSAWFRKAHFIKTVLTLVIGIFVLGLVSGVLFRIVFASYFDGFWDMNHVNVDMESLMAQEYPGLLNFLSVFGRVVFYGLLAPFCWFTAWLRVKETQSSDGV